MKLKKAQDLTDYLKKTIKLIEQEMKHVVLYESKLSSEGVQHTAIKKFYLKSA